MTVADQGVKRSARRSLAILAFLGAKESNKNQKLLGTKGIATRNKKDATGVLGALLALLVALLRT